ncbi:MAG: hypothetical protein ABFS16_11445 [Bacteroidota bacterium]
MKQIIILFLLTASTLNSFSQDAFCEQIVVEGKSSVKIMPEQFILI